MTCKRNAIFLTCAAVMLTACTTAPQYIRTCPPLVTYSPEFQRQAADQLEAMPTGSPVVKMTEDYLALRRAVKECGK